MKPERRERALWKLPHTEDNGTGQEHQPVDTHLVSSLSDSAGRGLLQFLRVLEKEGIA